MNDRPLIVHIVHRLDIGGLENGLVNLVNATGSGFRHAIVCLTTAGRFTARLASPEVDVIELQKKPGKDPRSYMRLWRILKRLRPSVVHTRNFGTLDCQFVAAAAGVPCRVHGEHGWDVADIAGSDRRRRALRRFSRLVVHKYVAVSRHIGDWLVGAVGLPAARVVCIVNGVDTDRFVPVASSTGPGNSCRFIYVGRLEPIKGPDVLVEAFALLCSSSVVRQQASLTMVGDGSMLGEIEARIRELGLADRVHLPGASDDVPASMANADVFVLPSRNEGISNTILEAMACGLPVIATATGGTPEIVAPDATGQLVPVEDAPALAAAMLRYVEMRELAASHGSAGRRAAVAGLSLKAMIAAYQRLYLDIVTLKGAAPCAE